MDIAVDKICDLIVRAREFDVKEAISDPDSGSNPGDDNVIDVLQDTSDDSIEEQLHEMIEGLNEDEKLDLVTLVWIGRGDFEADEWDDARTEARSQATTSTANYLLGTPNLADLLDEGLALIGRSCA